MVAQRLGLGRCISQFSEVLDPYASYRSQPGRFVVDVLAQCT